MDLWDYLAALKRFWWMAVTIPIAAALITMMVLPAAEWETGFKVLVLFPRNPDWSGSQIEGESIILDDTAILMGSDAYIADVHAALPAADRNSVSEDDIAEMLSAVRYSRAVTVTVSGEHPEHVRAVSQAAESVLPEAIMKYLVPPEWAQTEVRTIDHTGDPVQQTRQRWIAVGAITAASFLFSLGLVALTETIRRSYRAKYGAT